MEQVRKQTLEELIAAKLNYQVISETCGKPKNLRLSREFKRELQRASFKVMDIAAVLSSQCDNRLDFFEFEYLVDIICETGRQIENRLEVFCKMLAILGVGVVE